ncbi:hypothetical protein ACNKHX_00100 [Shigella flexneri]
MMENCPAASGTRRRLVLMPLVLFAKADDDVVDAEFEEVKDKK